eukprot:scaffold85520_cov26-Tisochrysis_lutea.AAC.1
MLAALLLPLAAPAPSSAWCDNRLAELRAHVDAARFDEAMELSVSLDRSASLPASCLEDEPYEGAADIFVYSDGDLELKLKDDPSRPSLYGVYARKVYTLLTAPDVAVRGFTLDGHFVIVWHADIRPNAMGGTDSGNLPGSSRLVEKYTLGTKKMIVIPVCGQDQTPDECNAIFNTHLIQSTYGGDVQAYLKAVGVFANQYLQQNSWGKFALDITVLPPMHVNGYTYATCGDYPAVGWTHWNPNLGSVDGMAFQQMSEEYGLNRKDFHFGAIALAKCSGYRWAGRGWVGIPGFAMNLVSNDMDPSFLHELGHNFGLNHGSWINAGARGRDVWETGFIETRTSSPTGGMKEYGSLLTPMGRGRPPNVHYTLPAKLIMDWISESDLVRIPYGTSCDPTPCGPYRLEPVDGTPVGGGALGIRLESDVEERHFWIGHFTQISGQGSAASIVSAAYKPNYGDGGVISKTVMVDKWQSGSNAEPSIYPSETIRLDVGPDGSPSYVWLDVLRVANGLLE